MPKLIDTITLPEGLRNLSTAELVQVVDELRDELIQVVSEVGGHFASSLGAAEITVALHHVFNTPADRLVWDVGHQAYIHKMLTGRRNRISSIRLKDGVSGFLKREESEFDCFGAGHAGTSISAAVGMSLALSREAPERKVVAIIGDGSMTAGMAFEALNHAGSLGLKNLIVLLNDNEMSISPNVGAISWLFSKAVTSKCSTAVRSRFKELHKKGYVPDLVYKMIDRAEEATQGFFAGPAMLFEAFGFRYIGPLDGHNVQDLVTALNHAKEQDVPVLIHAYTVKGKGYQPAEADPLKWHGVVPFDRSLGEFKSAGSKGAPSYTSIFADTMIELGKNNSKIIGITAAMPSGTGLDKFEKVLPNQFIDVGICEQHAVTFAAGLACEGYRPVCAIYSTFLQRAYDQVVHDVCIQNLPVVFAMDRGGLVGNDGETHQGVFDIAFLRTLPNIVLMSPRDENELRNMVFTAVSHPGPTAIRYPRGNGTGVALDKECQTVPIGKAEILTRGKDVLFVGYGAVVNHALQAAKILLDQHGITATVINARFAKPLDSVLFSEELPSYKIVCSIEDHAQMGGFGGALAEFIQEQKLELLAPLKRFGVTDSYMPHASQAEQYKMAGFDVESLVQYVLSNFKPERLAAVG